MLIICTLQKRNCVNRHTGKLKDEVPTKLHIRKTAMQNK